MFGNEKMCEKYRLNFCVFFSTKTRKRYERADTKHERYLTRPYWLRWTIRLLEEGRPVGLSTSYIAGMSKRAGGGDNATVTMGLCVGYLHKMIEEIKTYKPEASKSDKRLRSYGHSKFCMFSYWFSLACEWCSRLLNAAQTPTVENVDIPVLATSNSVYRLWYYTLKQNVSSILISK